METNTEFAKYFPHSSDDRWTFEATVGEDHQVHPMGVFLDLPGVAEAQARDGTHPVFAYSDPFEPDPGNYTVHRLTPEGLAVERLNLGPEATFRFDAPLFMVKAPWAKGRRDRSQAVALDVSAGTPLGAEVRLSVTMDGPQVVDTPAGRFTDVWCVTVHREMADHTDSSRMWYAPHWGLVKAETLTRQGMLLQLAVIHAVVGGATVGDPQRALTLENFAQRRLADAEEERRPFSMSELLGAIAPLNVDAQRIEGHILSEIAVRGQPELIFVPAEHRHEAIAPERTEGAAAIDWSDANAGVEMLAQRRSPTEVRIAFFRTERGARKQPGIRAQAGRFWLVGHGRPEVPTAEMRETRERIFRRVVALTTHNERRRPPEAGN